MIDSDREIVIDSDREIVQRYIQRRGRRRAEVDYRSRCRSEDCEKGDKKACCESGDPSEVRSCVKVEVAVLGSRP